MLDEQSPSLDLMEYLPLVQRAARNVKVKSYEYEMEDLINIGFIGLMDAVEKYDKTKKVPFNNYAYIRIKGSIIDEVRKNGKVPRSQLQRLNDYYKVEEELRNEFQRTPTEDEIIKKMGINQRQLFNIHNTLLALSNISLNEILFEEEMDGLTLIDTIEDKQAVQKEDLLLKEEEIGYLEQAVSHLNEREQLVLQLIYKEELQLKEIAQILEVSVPRVSQIRSKIILKLRNDIQNSMKEGDQ